MRRNINFLLLALLSLICLNTVAQENIHMIKMESEMLRLISSPDKDAGNQSTYEATHQNYMLAEEIADQIAAYAEEQNSYWGNYIALHTKAVNALQKQDYAAAEERFKRAVDFRHKYFPGESAGEDLQELMKIANHRKDQKAGLKYARQILAEPNVLPIHKGNELQTLKASDGIGTIEPVVEVNYQIINGNYDEALRLCEELSPESRAERMAVIYHRMGNNDKAYEYMAKFKKINDSIVLVSHGNVVASCFVQMNNERMKLEQKVLENENARWKQLFLFTLAAAVVIILALVIWQHHRRIKFLEKENEKLEIARQRAEQAFDLKNEFLSHITDELRAPLNPIQGLSDILGMKDMELQPEEREELSRHIKNSSKHITKIIDELAELSLYESKKSLPINYTISPNHLCRHMVDTIRPRCKEGVRAFFESELPDDLAVATNLEAIEALLRHLLDNAVKFTDQGVITVACSEYGDMVRISVTDTGRGVPPEQTEHVFDTFRELGDNVKLRGLGLAICKAIVKLLGGEIWLDTDYHEGTRFVFSIPKGGEVTK